MKTKILFLIYILCSTISFAQISIRFESKEKTLNKLRFAYKYQMDSLSKVHHYKTTFIEQEASDSINILENKATMEIKVLEHQTQKELQALEVKSNRFFNRIFFRKKYIRKFQELESNTSLKVSQIQQKYQEQTVKIQSRYQKEALKLTTDFEQKATKLNYEYQKKVNNI